MIFETNQPVSLNLSASKRIKEKALYATSDDKLIEEKFKFTAASKKDGFFVAIYPSNNPSGFWPIQVDFVMKVLREEDPTLAQDKALSKAKKIVSLFFDACVDATKNGFSPFKINIQPYGNLKEENTEV